MPSAPEHEFGLRLSPFHPPGTPLRVSELHLVILNVCPRGGAGPEEPNESSDTAVYFFPAHIKTDSFLIATEVNLVKLKPRVQIIAIHMTFKWIHQRQGR